MFLSKSIAEIHKRISLAASARNVDLVAVTKTVSVAALTEAYGLGLRNFGENKVQELLEKKSLLPQDIHWHMIGRLQTNKVKDILGKVALIHSLDRVDLYEKIVAEAHKIKLSQVECLLQVNMIGEISKAGFAPDQISEFLNQVAADSPVKIKGLMTMAPLTENRDEIRAVFRATQALMEKLKRTHSQFGWQHLSMGMSGDFEIAIEEGATMVRIGTALFGARTVKF